MKKLIAFLLIVSCAVASFGCTNSQHTQSTPPAAIPPERPEDTNLEFWIGQDVADVDFSEHDEKYGWFGAHEFLGKGYHFSDDNGGQEYPEEYVSYLITAFPDYADGGSYVTDITIKDPDVQLYGLTIYSDVVEFQTVFEAMGYAVSIDFDRIPIVVEAEKDGITFRFSYGESIHIKAKVTNRKGIHY